MSEKEPLHKGPERNESLSNNELDKIREKIDREIDEKASKAEREHRNIDALSKSVEQHAISGKEMTPGDRVDNKHHPVLVNKHLKEIAYSRAMTRVRKHLSLPSRTFSKVAHSKFIDSPSEVIGNTVARPSGMLGGAFFAAVGSSILLWVTKHYGYEYNYLAVILLFAIGLVVGLSAELVWKSLKRR
jgi:hypothetical protein